ncbi:MAG: leucyl/phenylalanyl-tRNA--protein transferase [Alphaproteobacteria bacterium]|nr:leucyl/phenylalanyl-tRNA--protein transferase [Alphaproteobacteria bacterium]
MRVFGTGELLECYARGVFPMAEARDDARIYLLNPDERGILPLNGLHIPKRLRRTLRKTPFRITINQCFNEVVGHCAAPARGREETWINDGIRSLYSDLHVQGYAHSLEVWNDDRLVGGLYGVSLGSAFFGESMFSTMTDASKIGLVHLVARLNKGGYTLLDTQFTTEHLETFGVITILREDYQVKLASALEQPADFYALDANLPADEILKLAQKA